jgi:GxxExxY protein
MPRLSRLLGQLAMEVPREGEQTYSHGGTELNGEVGMDLGEDQLAGEIIGSAISIHRALGPGLFESVYEALLEKDLARKGFRIDRQKVISFEYDGIVFERAFVIDLLVESLVAVELKSVEKTSPVHRKQLQTYLRLIGIRVGLLLNFGEELMKDGVHRAVNGYPRSPVPPVPPCEIVAPSGAGRAAM